MTSDLSNTDHAWLRMAQRNLPSADVGFVLTHGEEYWRAGALHVVLRYKDIPIPDRRRFGRLDGTVVLLNDAGTDVITVYRGNPKRADKVVRSKTKTDLKKNRRWH